MGATGKGRGEGGLHLLLRQLANRNTDRDREGDKEIEGNRADNDNASSG